MTLFTDIQLQSSLSKSLSVKYALLFLYILTLFYVTGWFNFHRNIPIDLDELAWVQDAQVFDWRAQKNGRNLLDLGVIILSG